MIKYPYHDKKHGVWITTNGEGKAVVVSDEALDLPESEQNEVTKGVRKAIGLDELSILNSIEKSVE